MIATGGINVAEVFLARRSYNAGDFGFGLLWAGSGVGLVMGGLAASGLIAAGLRRAYVRLLITFAFGIAAAAAAPNVWVGAAAMVVAGFGNGGAVVANITLVQRGAPDQVRGRAFTMLMSANYAVLAIAFLGAGPLTNSVGPRWVYVGSAAMIVLGAAIAWRLTRGIEPEAAM
jgi:MFS family permease